MLSARRSELTKENLELFSELLDTLFDVVERFKAFEDESDQVACLNDFIFVTQMLMPIEVVLNSEKKDSGYIISHWQKVLPARLDLMEKVPRMSVLESPINQLIGKIAAICDEKVSTWYVRRWHAIIEAGKQDQAANKPVNPAEALLIAWLSNVQSETFEYVIEKIVDCCGRDHPLFFFKLPLISFMTEAQLKWVASKYQEQLVDSVKHDWLMLIKPEHRANKSNIWNYTGAGLATHYFTWAHNYADTHTFDALVTSENNEYVNAQAVSNFCQALSMVCDIDFSPVDAFWGYSRFLLCCKYQPAVARRVLTKYHGDINQFNSGNVTPYQCAASSGDVALLRALKAREAKDSAALEHSAFMAAAVAGNLEAAKFLFDPTVHTSPEAMFEISRRTEPNVFAYLYEYALGCEDQMKMNLVNTMFEAALKFYKDEIVCVIVSHPAFPSLLQQRSAVVGQDTLRHHAEVALARHVDKVNATNSLSVVITSLLRAGFRVESAQLQTLTEKIVRMTLKEMDDVGDGKTVLNSLQCQLLLLTFIYAKHTSQELPEPLDPVAFFKLLRDDKLFSILYHYLDRQLMNRIIKEEYKKNNSLGFMLAQHLFVFPSEMSFQLVNDLFEAVFLPLINEWRGYETDLHADWSVELASILQACLSQKLTDRDHNWFVLPGILVFKNGINCHFRLRDGETMLMMALRLHPEFYKKLVKREGVIPANSSISIHQESLLMLAIELQYEAVVKDLLQRQDNLEWRDCANDDAFAYAVRSGNVRIVECLLEAFKNNRDTQTNISARLHRTNLLGQSPATSVCENNDAAMLHCLVNAGFDVNSRHPKTGKTILMEAAVRGRLDLVEHLLKLGAHVVSTDIAGRNAGDYAQAARQTDIVKTLSAHVASVVTQTNTAHFAKMYARPKQDESHAKSTNSQKRPFSKK